MDSLHTPNANGHIPLCGDDPTRPNEFYFRDVDEIIRLAAAKGLYIGLLPTWGDKVHQRKWQPEFGRYTDYDVRKQAYRSVFSGACGHTYGHHSVWQFWTLQCEPLNFPMLPWDEAVLRPGAAQMVHLKNLMLSRPYFSRIPAPEMLPDILPTPPVTDVEKDRSSSIRAAHAVATRCAEGTYGLVYFPQAKQTLRVDARPLKGPLQAWWYDPRNGRSYPAGEHPSEILMFTSPIAGPDWVLVLDAAAQNFAPPGQDDQK